MITVDVVCYKYKPLKNGELPIKIKVCKDRKTRYINLGVSTKQEFWDFENNRPKDNCPDKEMLESLISNKISEVKSKIVELKAGAKDFSATTLIEKVQHKTSTETVGDLFKKEIAALKEEKRTGYALSVEQVYNSLIKFNRHLDLHFSEIDVTWLKKYELWLRRQGLAENTIGIRFRTFRRIYNLAIEQKIVKQEYYPFREFRVSRLHQETAKRAVRKVDVINILNYPEEGKGHYMELAIDLFKFSYFMGGINFVDMAYLTWKNISEGRLIYYRKKTGKLINLPVQEDAKLLLDKYSKAGEQYIFPIFSSFHKTEQQRLNRLHKVITKVNACLKTIGKELNLPITLTTYVARHSYATVLKRAGVSTSIISESLGHSSEKVTQIYLDSFENSQIDKAMENLKLSPTLLPHIACLYLSIMLGYFF